MNNDTRKPNDELDLALQAFKAGTHTDEQFQMLMTALPPDVRRKMDREAGEILGIDLSKPDAYAEDGQPLWLLSHEEIKARTGATDEDIQTFEAKYVSRMPKPDPRVSVLEGRVKLDRPLFVESEDKDEDGNPIVYCSMEGAGVLAVDAAREDHEAGKSNSKAIRIFNAWMAMARQRGVSSIIIDRLLEAIREKKSPARILADVVRVTKKVSVIEIMNQGGHHG